LKIQILLKSDKNTALYVKTPRCFTTNIKTDIITVALVIDASMVSVVTVAAIVTVSVLFTRGYRGYMYVPVPEVFFLR
jgi:hypothetical protein